MRVLSFNVYKKNPSLTELVTFLRRENADIVCLQEYPAHEIKRLEALKGYRLHVAQESYIHKFVPRKDSHLLLVILSKYRIAHAESVQHLQHTALPLRHRIAYEEVSVQFHFVDITDGKGRPFRVFNCHLECTTNPAQRLSQFEEIARYDTPERASIYCGDFNTFSTPFLSPFVFWLFGYKAKHLAVHEPRLFRKLFARLKLQNPIEKQATFSYLPLQLDYILVPDKIPVRKAFVHEHTYGSDHYPISAEF